jgi:hypothetical protein
VEEKMTNERKSLWAKGVKNVDEICGQISLHGEGNEPSRRQWVILGILGASSAINQQIELVCERDGGKPKM